MNRLKVGVLMGGKSCEKEVSFNSGRTICDHLDTSYYNVIPLFQKQTGELFILPLRFLHRGKISDFEHRLAQEAQLIAWDDLKQLVDFVYIALHGRYGEDGTVQGFLEILGIPYLGSKVFSSALGMDKVTQKEFLKMRGIDVPKDITIAPHELSKLSPIILQQRLQAAGISLPCIVKPHKEGSSLGITVVKTIDQLLPAIQHAATIHADSVQSVLIEEKLEGMEFTCIILTDYLTGNPLFMPATEVVPESDFFDYQQKYMPGRATKFTPARCSAEHMQKIQQTCLATMQALEITTIARIDGFLTKDERVVIIDPNTLTGMAPSSFLFRQAAEINMSHTQLINHLIATELMQHRIAVHTQQQTQEAMTEKIRVGVLLGGNTNEKEISLESGRNVAYKLSPQKYEMIPLFVNKDLELYKLNQRLLVHNSTAEIEHDLQPSMRVNWADLPHHVDFVFIGLHGGVGENGCVQGALEMLGIPYNGSSIFASSLCMDKFKTAQYLKAKGFDVPEGILLSRERWESSDRQELLHEITNAIPFPLIVKPHDDGCSVMVSKVSSAEELQNALAELFTQKSHALIEECIIGMELTVGVIGNDQPKALPPSQAVASAGILSIEEKFLPGAGENQTPAPLPAQALQFVQRTMEGVYAAIGCKGYSRIDCFYQSPTQSPTGQERVVILEINSLPGMTPATVIFHQAAELGIKPMDFIDMIIELGFQEHGKRGNIRDHQVQEEAGTLLQN